MATLKGWDREGLQGCRVLAVRLGALGDTICFLPVLRALRREIGETGHLTALVRSGFGCLTSGRILAHESIDADRWPYSTVLATGAWPNISPVSWDLVLGWTRSENLPAFVVDPAHICRMPALPAEACHAVAHGLEGLRDLAVAVEGVELEGCIELSDFEWHRAHEWLRAGGLEPGRFVAIHPGSGGESKVWSVEGFDRLASQICAGGGRVCWVVGEAERGWAQRLNRQDGGVLAMELPLRLLAGVLALSGAYVGNDSGVSHLSAAMGAKSWVFFGPSDPIRWAPIGATVAPFSWGPEELLSSLRVGAADALRGVDFDPSR